MKTWLRVLIAGIGGTCIVSGLMCLIFACAYRYEMTGAQLATCLFLFGVLMIVAAWLSFLGEVDD